MALFFVNNFQGSQLMLNLSLDAPNDATSKHWKEKKEKNELINLSSDSWNFKKIQQQNNYTIPCISLVKSGSSLTLPM